MSVGLDTNEKEGESKNPLPAVLTLLMSAINNSAVSIFSLNGLKI
jgi:hypothetical protein